MEIPDLGYATAQEAARIKELLHEKIRVGGLLQFAQAVEPKFEVYDHVKLLAEHLEAVEAGEIENLAISMPPRHGKSFLSSYIFPLWYLSKDPSRKIMLCSYAASPAERFSRQIRDRIGKDKDFLGHMKLNRKAVGKDIWELEQGGGVIAAGVQGALTSMGCNLLIVDDPVKDQESALSDNNRRKAYEWYTSTASTRVEPGGGRVMIQTRWHDGDLMGQVLDADGDRWTVLTLPALALEDDPLGREIGEALCDERYNLQDLQKIRTSVGEYVWSALYQQDPTPESGSMFRKSEARYFYWVDGSNLRLGERIVPAEDLTIFLVADIAGSIASSADYTVIGTFGYTDRGELLLMNIHRGKWKPSKVAQEIRSKYNEAGASWVTIEKGPISISVIEAVDDLIVKAVAPTGHKVARALPAQFSMEQGKIYFPDPQKTSWMQEFENELYRFPTGKHDDQVDCLSWACDTVKSIGVSAGEFLFEHSKTPLEDNVFGNDRIRDVFF